MSSIARSEACRVAVTDQSLPPASGNALRVVFGCAALALVLFLSLPLMAMVVRSVQASRGLPDEATATLFQALRLSLLTSSIAMVFIVATGIPLGYCLARWHFR